ncbi:MAG: arginine--tRNA ligase [Chloroflexaceae bacterium]|nr:arginine--tRNA ligase [Chloroflexaceae bacterium]
MEYVLDRFVAEVRSAINATGNVPADLVDLQPPKANIPADLAFPSFRAARELGVTPPRLTQELAAALQFAPDSLVAEVVASGPFLNFGLNPQRLAIEVLGDITRMGDTYGHDDLGQQQTIVIDYSSPNVAKRMHVGHIRSTIIGQSLVHILRALGFAMIGDNHLGDWGKQFGVIIAAIKRYGKPTSEGEMALEALEERYVRYSNEMQLDEALDDEARHCSLRLEQGDPEARDLWQWCVETTLEANQKNYDRLGVSFEHTYGESFYESMLTDVIALALQQGIAQTDEDGAVVVPSLDNLPSFLLQRSDGGTLYMTRDLATVLFRVEQFRPVRLIYVVGSQQELHFRQLTALVKALAIAPEIELIHVGFGTIFDAQGQPLSTRRGNMIYLQHLLDDAVARARKIVETKNDELSEEEKDRVAEQVGIGAVIYNDLYQDSRRNITLDWERMLATEGNSATYLQYSHARCCSILRRAGAGDPRVTDAATLSLLTQGTEQQLIKHLARLPEAIREAGQRYAPFVIADWCYTTARAFGVFFEQCPVLKADSPSLRDARLTLVAATAQALKNGLHLLGIQSPERM